MATTEKQADILYRVTQKSTGYVIYVVRGSDGESIYHVTVSAGIVRGCDCPAGAHGRACYHKRSVQAKEEDRMMAEIAQAEPVATPAAPVVPVAERGQLNGPRLVKRDATRGIPLR